MTIVNRITNNIDNNVYLRLKVNYIIIIMNDRIIFFFGLYTVQQICCVY